MDERRLVESHRYLQDLRENLFLAFFAGRCDDSLVIIKAYLPDTYSLSSVPLDEPERLFEFILIQVPWM